jgi:Fe-S oxidoreductase
MIDVKKALSQRCYIIFDTNEQLRKFVKEHCISVETKIYDDETTLHIYKYYYDVYEEDITDYITGNVNEVEKHNELDKYPVYHHTELTITDDGE